MISYGWSDFDNRYDHYIADTITELRNADQIAMNKIAWQAYVEQLCKPGRGLCRIITRYVYRLVINCRCSGMVGQFQDRQRRHRRRAIRRMVRI